MRSSSLRVDCLVVTSEVPKWAMTEVLGWHWFMLITMFVHHARDYDSSGAVSRIVKK